MSMAGRFKNKLDLSRQAQSLFAPQLVQQYIQIQILRPQPSKDQTCHFQITKPHW